MPSKNRPRHGSMAVWPRVRAKRSYPRQRSVAKSSEPKLLSFPVYKAGMTHVIATGQVKGSRRAGQDSFYPVTILECPPMRIASLRLYKYSDRKKVVVKQLNFKVEKELSRRTHVSKSPKGQDELASIKPEEYSDVTVQVYTIPKTTTLKKTPELFEVNIGGDVAAKIEFVKNHLDKNITINDVFKEGQFVDVRAISKGKGFVGAVKRFGIDKKSHKTEKGTRTPGNLSGWSAQGHTQYRVAHAGGMGYHQRVQYNNLVMKISDKPEEVNPDGGFINYGNVKTTYLMMRGSIPGAKKRMILLCAPIRIPPKETYSSDSIKHISKQSPQGA